MSTPDPQTRSVSDVRRSLCHVLGGVGLLALGTGTDVHSSPAREAINGGGAGDAVDQLGIKQLIYRYAMAIDTLDASAFADCFAGNAVLWGENNPLGANFRLQGKDIRKIIEWHRSYEFTMHNVQNHLFRIRDRTATGLTYCVATCIRSKAGGRVKFDQYIHYHDELTKEGDRWLFLNRQFRLFFTTEGPIENFAPDSSRAQAQSKG